MVLFLIQILCGWNLLAAEVGEGDAYAPPSEVEQNVDAYTSLRKNYVLLSPADYQVFSRATDRCIRAYRESTTRDPKVMVDRMPGFDVTTLVNQALANGLPSQDEMALRMALNYVLFNIDQVTNLDHVAVMDYTQPGSAKRLYLISLKDGSVTAHMGGQGIGNVPGKFKGNVAFNRFSNTPDTNLSAKGCVLSATRPVYGSFGAFYPLLGLNATNNLDCNRAVGTHVTPYKNFIGNSHACISVSQDDAGVLKDLGGGTIICTNPSS